MSHLYSPTRRCDAAHTMVRTDQPVRNCALEHGCPPRRECPLAGSFAQVHAVDRKQDLWSAVNQWRQ